MTLVNYFRDHFLYTIYENIEYGKKGNIVNFIDDKNGNYKIGSNENKNDLGFIDEENDNNNNNNIEEEEEVEKEEEENINENEIHKNEIKWEDKLDDLRNNILRLCIRLSRTEIQVPVSSTGTDAICFLVPVAEAFSYNPDFDVRFSDNFRDNLDYIGGYEMTENVDNENEDENENDNRNESKLNRENDVNTTENVKIENDEIHNNIVNIDNIENSESDSDESSYRNKKKSSKNNHSKNNITNDNHYKNNKINNITDNNENRVTYDSINYSEKNNKNYTKNEDYKKGKNKKNDKNDKNRKNYGVHGKEKSKINLPNIVRDTPGLSYFRGPFLSGNVRISEYENILKSVYGLNNCIYNYENNVKTVFHNRDLDGENDDHENINHKNENKNKDNENVFWHLPDKLKEIKKWEINGLKTKEEKRNFTDLDDLLKSRKNSELSVSTSNTTSFPFSVTKSVFPSYSSTSSFSPITPILIPKSPILQKETILNSNLNSRSSSSSSLLSPPPRTTSPPPFILKFGIKNATICNWCNRNSVGEDIKIKGELSIKKGENNIYVYIYLIFVCYIFIFVCYIFVRYIFV